MKKKYSPPQVTSFTVEERFTALQEVVQGLGADVRRLEAAMVRDARDRRVLLLMARAHEFAHSLQKKLPVVRGYHEQGTNIQTTVDTYELGQLTKDLNDFIREVRS